ncbi:hypothetical protein PHYSODRAFT_330019 [Phytophthora sojae]|uniref:Uncharacterized protein n=1 Tax=Phytophthora sojae (strain P6497) TaxID=1094619 RepID=G4Z2P5_PHYSP|nr:hypothetical protein PHYSODRAFT_330019 [Phytophthora sojae]EGZ22170.1 hypothetical protein PHYSODRAFT_330019 [Phytophthora sojae]|eukprot:XP_009524887.1 hypothetical protein PHYSODRAFT_330019 [Phytophthora sojae]
MLKLSAAMLPRHIRKASTDWGGFPRGAPATTTTSNDDFDSDYKYDNNRVHIDDQANEYDKTIRDYSYGGNHDCRYNDNDAHGQHYDCSNHNDFGYDGYNSNAYDYEHKYDVGYTNSRVYELLDVQELTTDVMWHTMAVSVTTMYD